MKKTLGYIIDGVYYKKAPKLDQMADLTASTHKTWSHDDQRQEHQRDIIQPYANGKPNEDFIEQYPEESKLYGLVQKEE